jgi:hypothetical protein
MLSMVDIIEMVEMSDGRVCIIVSADGEYAIREEFSARGPQMMGH